MREREQSAAFVAYPDTAEVAVERRREPLRARPVESKLDTDAMIKRAMDRFPTVRAYLAR